MDRPSPSVRILRMRDLTNKLGLRPSTIYEMISKGKFPRPFKIVQDGRAAGWLEFTIDEWLDSRRSEKAP
jgi:prophage regulatory protein